MSTPDDHKQLAPLFYTKSPRGQFLLSLSPHNTSNPFHKYKDKSQNNNKTNSKGVSHNQRNSNAHGTGANSNNTGTGKNNTMNKPPGGATSFYPLSPPENVYTVGAHQSGTNRTHPSRKEEKKKFRSVNNDRTNPNARYQKLKKQERFNYHSSDSVHDLPNEIPSQSYKAITKSNSLDTAKEFKAFKTKQKDLKQRATSLDPADQSKSVVKLPNVDYPHQMAINQKVSFYADGKGLKKPSLDDIIKKNQYYNHQYQHLQLNQNSQPQFHHISPLQICQLQAEAKAQENCSSLNSVNSTNSCFYSGLPQISSLSTSTHSNPFNPGNQPSLTNTP